MLTGVNGIALQPSTSGEWSVEMDRVSKMMTVIKTHPLTQYYQLYPGKLYASTKILCLLTLLPIDI